MRSYHYSRGTVELDQKKIAELFKVLGINDAYDAEIARFFKINYPQDRNFYHLVSHVLTMNGICTIIASNNWEPTHLFYQLGRVLKNHRIELKDSARNGKTNAYDITFSIDGIEESVSVNIADPSALFYTINKHISDYQFVRLISHLKQRRAVEWLLIPVQFDSDTFKQLTGCSELREEWEPRQLK